MQSKHSFMEYADRYLFDNTLLHQGYHQVDSEQDCWYYGHWLNSKTLELVEYAEGDVYDIKFENTAECIAWLLDKRDVLGLLHIDDWSQNWSVRIERSELELYMSYMRSDAIV